MPMSASRGESSPDSTSNAAPVTAQIASGQSKGLMMTPAVAIAATVHMIA
jgi:hypothetical protein